MKEIKFRIFDELLQKFHYWTITQSYPKCLIREYVEGNSQQFTGLKDKNGKEIYEGDIIYEPRQEDGRGEIGNCVVEFKRGSFIQKGKRGEYGIPAYFNPKEKELEVIGNLHENSELLE